MLEVTMEAMEASITSADAYTVSTEVSTVSTEARMETSVNFNENKQWSGTRPYALILSWGLSLDYCSGARHTSGKH